VDETWRKALAAVALAWLALIAAFASDWLAMLDQWWNSSTYNHMLLVPPIVGWLLWQRRAAFAEIRPSPNAWGILALAGAGLVWVLGAIAGLNLLRHAGAVAMLPASALLVLGPRAVALQLFPLAYLAFLIPFGDELVPPLQLITADLTIALTRLSGIPAIIEGVFIDTPAGLFEVAEACSGVKFLVAMVALGVLVCNVCFKSWKRRAAFMVLCVLAPILANGVRAWGTIFAAQYVGVETAAGIDHIIYGWIFFAMVMAAVLAIGWRYFDRGLDEAMVDAEAAKRSAVLDWLERGSIKPGAGFFALVAVTLASQGWAGSVQRLEASLPSQVFLPAVPGWQRVDFAPNVPWEPRANGADHRLLGSYADARGRRVDVFVALYSAQREGKEAGGFGEGALRPDSAWSWEGSGPAIQDARSDRLRANGRVERLALTWYRVGDLLTGSNSRLKLQTIQDRLLLRARPTTMLILSAEAQPGIEASLVLADFRKSTGPVDRWMDRIAGVR
jgi:exosortase A